MRLKSRLDLTPERFAVFKNSVRHAIEAERARRGECGALPDVLGVKLTNRCNLRCIHCYQWNPDGYHLAMPASEQKADLNVDLFRRLLEDTRERLSRLYLWGGEPLVHRDIKTVLSLLTLDSREVTICTNAHLIDKHFDALVALGGRLELLVALEGFREHHDAIRGEGSFEKVTINVNRLMSARRRGDFLGKISVHTVINNENVSSLHDFIRYLADAGVDLVLVTLPWYIATETSKAMDDYVAEHFSWLIDVEPKPHSWDAFKYCIDPNLIGELVDQLERIGSTEWPIDVRFQPELEREELVGFVTGQAMNLKSASHCAALTARIDIGPTGKATACKFFSEFVVGDLNQANLSEIWKSESYERIRELSSCGLTPACSKCNVLHLQKHSIPTHF
jgi:MoaA/NifB/PqqE/SkfB family radical SAM enzyme